MLEAAYNIHLAYGFSTLAGTNPGPFDHALPLDQCC